MNPLENASGHIELRVCMPIHNAGMYLREAVESVLADLPKNAEFILVDDGSTDCALESLPVCLLDDPRITILRNLHPTGVSSALNRAIKHGSSPEFLAIAEHDDVVIPGRLKEQLEFLKAHPRVGVVGGRGRYLGSDGAVFGQITTGPETKEAFEKARMKGEPILVLHPSATFRRRALDSCGFYDSVFDGAQDLELINRLVYSGGWEVRTLPAFHVLYRIHDGASSFLNFRSQRMITRYVRERNVSVLEKQDLCSFDAWLKNPSRSLRKRLRWMRHDRGALWFRQAGLRWLSGYRTRSLLLGAGAVLLHPRWVFEKLRRQMKLTLR